MSEISLRRATPNDAVAIADLAVQLGYPVSSDEMMARLSKLPAETECVMVGSVDGEVKAWMQIGVAMSIESEPFAEIRGLVVDEKLRASGLGSRLVDYAKTWAQNKNVSNLRVRSNMVRTATHAFYERRGFIVSKSQKVFAFTLPQSA
jgi:N-acetylglutamate synthase-like GNAT family acetyltransferase